MENKLSLSSSIFNDAVKATNEVIQEAIDQLQTGDFSKADVTLKLTIKPVHKEGDQMFVEVAHKESYACKKERKEKGTSQSDAPIIKVDDTYIQGEDPQMRLEDDHE